jgi:hypothetical protein
MGLTREAQTEEQILVAETQISSGTAHSHLIVTACLSRFCLTVIYDFLPKFSCSTFPKWFHNQNSLRTTYFYITAKEIRKWACFNMKKAVFWDMVPCRYCVNRRFRGMYRLHLQGRRKSASEEPAWASTNSNPIVRHIPEFCFLHSHRRENLKSYLSFDKLVALLYVIITAP